MDIKSPIKPFLVADFTIKKSVRPITYKIK